MTDKEMNKLADIIVLKIVGMQKELDKAFLEAAAEQGAIMNQELKVEAAKDSISVLEAELAEALQGEQYELAHELQTRIEYLKRQFGK